jgi:uncharacterized protein (TIGR02186 family)
MSRHRAIAALLATLLALAAAPAGAQGGAFLNNDPTVAAALADSRISITSHFTGATVDVFGVVNGLNAKDDVVVVLRGPRPIVELRRKRRVIGVWVNGERTDVEGAPAYYSVSSTRALEQVASREELARHGIGIEVAPMRPIDKKSRDAEPTVAELQSAIVRIKENEGLYNTDPDGVTIYDAGLFHARMRLPPGAPTGTYRADVFVFRNGVAAARRSTELNVEKVGIERYITDVAHDHPFAYGLSSVAFAVFAGWLAGAASRRWW